MNRKPDNSPTIESLVDRAAADMFIRNRCYKFMPDSRDIAYPPLGVGFHLSRKTCDVLWAMYDLQSDQLHYDKGTVYASPKLIEHIIDQLYNMVPGDMS